MKLKQNESMSQLNGGDFLPFLNQLQTSREELLISITIKLVGPYR